ncbi:four helix bundle protein [soil metagenome]
MRGNKKYCIFWIQESASLGYFTRLAPKNMRPHRKLIAWQESIELVKKIYIITSTFPETEKFGIISQLRRAAVSVPCNIAEGAGRNTKKEFRHFLYISSGSASEVDTLLFISKELGYIKEPEFNRLESLNDKVSALLNGLIKSIKVAD